MIKMFLHTNICIGFECNLEKKHACTSEFEHCFLKFETLRISLPYWISFNWYESCAILAVLVMCKWWILDESCWNNNTEPCPTFGQNRIECLISHIFTQVDHLEFGFLRGNFIVCRKCIIFQHDNNIKNCLIVFSVWLPLYYIM